mmetsp:Transcript_29980/g.86243  ORF Transcript_29980/g.86243 Transcript_29980/m.86243 type:complete len:487 (-) Transcript_29980:149-1609(-)
MGQAFVTCGYDVPSSAEDNEPATPGYTASSRSSQMLCAARDRSASVVCAAVGRAVFVYCTASGKKLGSLDGHASPVTCLASSPHAVFSGSVDKTVIRWDLKSRQPSKTFRGHKGPIWCLAVTGSRVFSAGDDAQVIIWDAETGSRLETISRHQSPVRCMVEANGILLTGSDSGALVCTAVVSSALISEVTAHEAAITAVLATDDGTVYTGAADGHIKRWEPFQGACSLVLRAHTEAVGCLIVSGGSLYSGSRDCTIRRWDPMTGALLGTYAHGTISFRQRAAYLSASEDGSVSIRRGGEGEKFTKIDHEDGRVSLRADTRLYLSASANGHVAASSMTIGADERFELLENQDGSVSLRSCHGGFVGCGEGGLVAARSPAHGEPLPAQCFAPCFIEAHWSGVTSLILVSGALMSGGADRSVKLWDPDSCMLLASLEGRTGITSLLETGGSLYAGAARGTPLRLPKPKGSAAGRGSAKSATETTETASE